MRLDCECRIHGYHGETDWVTVADVLSTSNAVRVFAERMDRKDFELFMHEDDPREVWVREIGGRDHEVFDVTFQTVKQFSCESR
jgi:dihydroxyacetone kinase